MRREAVTTVPADPARSAKMAALVEGAVYAVLLSMPFSVLVPVGPALAGGTLPLYVTPGLELADVPGAILIGLVGAERWWRRRVGVPPPRRGSPLLATLLVVVLLAALGRMHAMAPALATYTTLRWLFALALGWAIAQAEVPPGRMVWVLGVGLAAHVLVALAQVLLDGPVGLPGELALPAAHAGATTVAVGDGVRLRGYGLTFHPNVLGGYLAVGLVLMLPLLRERAARALWLVLLVGLLLTLSRAAALAAVLCVPPTAWWLVRGDPVGRRLLRRRALWVGCALTLAAPLWWQPVLTRVDPLLRVMRLPSPVALSGVAAEAGSLAGRQHLNRLAMDCIGRRPLLGIGAGNFPVWMRAANSYMLPQYVHNVPLLLAAEVGVGGAMAWLLLPIVTGLLLWRGPRTPWLVAGSMAVGALMVISLFDCYPWSLTAGRLLTVTVLAFVEAPRSGVAVDAGG